MKNNGLQVSAIGLCKISAENISIEKYVKRWQCQLRVFVESQCRFKMYCAKCFLEVINGVSGNNRIRKFVPVAYDSIAEMILCNVTLKLRGLKFKTVTFGGNGRGFDMYSFICVYINETMKYFSPQLYPMVCFLHSSTPWSVFSTALPHGLFSPQLYPMVCFLHSSTPWSVFSTALPHGGVSTPVYLCWSVFSTALPHGGVSTPVYLCWYVFPTALPHGGVSTPVYLCPDHPSESCVLLAVYWATLQWTRKIGKFRGMVS